MALEWTEYITVVLSVSLSIVISVFTSQQDNKKSDRREPKLSLLPVIASLIASFTSGVSLLGKPAESYQFGVGFQILYSAMIIINFSTLYLVFMPVLVKMKGSSVYEYFKLRFDSRLERLATIQFILSKVFQTALTSLPPAYILCHFSGMGLNSIICLLVLLTTFYTMIGGLRGVVWTDTLQAIVMLIALVALLVASVYKVGGIDDVFRLAYETERLSIPFPSFDPTDRLSLWSFLAGFNICMSVNQSWYQRIRSLSSHNEIKISILCQATGMLVYGLGSCFMGLALHAYYFGCDPKEARLIHSYSNIVVYWLDDVGKKFPGLRGLYIAGITCASISTMSTNMNTVGTMIVDDLLGRVSSKRDAGIRLWTAVVGGTVVLITILIKNSGSLVELTYVFISLEGATSGLFYLGTLFVPATAKGAIAGGITSLAFNFFLIIGSSLSGAKNASVTYPVKTMSVESCNFNITTSNLNIIERSIESEKIFYLFRISPFAYGSITVFITFVVGAVASCLLPNVDNARRTNRDPDLYSPWVQRFLPQSKEKIYSTVASKAEEADEVNSWEA